jgi:hypothetical protein
MAELTRTKARVLGLGAHALVVEARAAEDLVGLAGEFDGAYSNFGALNCVALPRLGAALGSVLRPGAPLLLSLMGACPLPHTLRRLLTGRGERRGQTHPRVAGTPVPVRYPAIREVQAELGHDFLWRDAFALGVLLPDPAHAAWAAEHPQGFGVLATLEARIRRWPLLRGFGDHFVLEGLRRAA